MARARQSVITPASFAVAPELIGLPLAGGGRRLAAMILDLILVALLVKSGGVFFALGAAFVLFRASARWMQRGTFVVLALRAIAAVLLFIGVASLWGRFWREAPSRLADSVANVSIDGDSSEVRLGTVGATALDLLALNRETDSTEARERADRMVRRFVSGNLSTEQSHELRDFRRSLEQAARGDSTVDGIKLSPLAAKSLNDAIAAVDTTSMDAPVDPVRDSIEELKDEVKDLRRKNAELASSSAIDMKSDAPVLHFLKNIADDFGLGLGWTGLYFTAFLALWRGQTPGKRVVGIRVVRLDGKPMGFWASFERFGGYSASVITGLLGFAQLLWDRNRQALHDKIAETVVVRI